MKKLIAIILCAALAVSLVVGAPTADAASKKAKALKAYRSFMAKKNSNYRFALAYIDKDGVPELVVDKNVPHPIGVGETYVYYYKNGKVKKPKNLNIGYNENFRYYKKTGVIYYHVNFQGDVTYYEKLSKGKIIRKAMKLGPSMGVTKSSYSIRKGGALTNVSKSKYKSYVRKLTKGKSLKSASFHYNTASNRYYYL